MSDGYWYPQGDRARSGLDVLAAMRRYREAEQAMRRRTRVRMKMNETDLLALRHLLAAHQADRIVTAKDLARHLGISSASTTVLIDRLVRSGHVRRETHPTDRRAVVIVATRETDHEVRATLGAMHAGMLAVAESLSPDEAGVVADFLERMRVVVEEGAAADETPQ